MRWFTAMVALVACGAEREPRGVIVDAEPWAWSSRNDAQGFGKIIVDRLLGTLVAVGDKGEALPVLAESVVADDRAAVWTATLRRDARFASGRSVTSADVVASIAAHEGGAGMRATALDERRVRIELSVPRSSFPTDLGRVRIMRADQAAQPPGSIALDALDASGAWTIARMREPDVVLVPREDLASPPAIEGYVMRAAGDKRRVLGMVLAGEADAANWSLLRDNDAIAAADHLVALGSSRTLVGVLRFNCRDPRLADARVRRALNLAIDREPIVRRFLKADARPAASLIEGGVVYDPVQAEALLDESGWPRGPDGVRMALTVRISDYFFDLVDVAQAVAADLHAVGVELTIEHNDNPIADPWQMRFGQYVDQSQPGQLEEFFRRGVPRTGMAGGLRDFGHCTDPAQPWLAFIDAGVANPARAQAIQALRVATIFDPPAIFVFRASRFWWIHKRFVPIASSFPLPSYMDGYRLREGMALPRDSLSYWLER